MSSVEQDESCDQLDGGEEISSEFVVARGDGPVVFDFVEEALDEIALAIEHEIAIALRLAVGFWRDHRSDGSLIECVDQRIGVVSLVADERPWIDIFEQRSRASQVMFLPWRQHQVTGITQRIDERVDFGAHSSARLADRLPAVFFRAPALRRSALTLVASMLIYS